MILSTEYFMHAKLLSLKPDYRVDECHGTAEPAIQAGDS